ncbi:uncharacterized protein ACNLHF_017118 [Anomaloglossus baeobatrachus]|uniref:uncharacterized protein LOC142244243 n=1 Tax=Anomaloglossus baeobatrachus TaxID=238106 RepID=UPI003F50CE8D
MSWYERMRLDVEKLIQLVESMPAIWDPIDPAYSDRQYRHRCWQRIVNELFPLFESAPASLQRKIEEDVRKRWRTVKDRFYKFIHNSSKSGMSPAKKCLYYYELQFLSTSRRLRSTEGNVNPLPQAECMAEDREGPGSDTEPVAHRDPEAASSASNSCYRASESAENMPTTSANSAMEEGQLSTRSDEPVPSTRFALGRKKKNKRRLLAKSGEDDVSDELTLETVNLIKKSAYESDTVKFLSSFAGRMEAMNPKKKNTLMGAMCSLFEHFERDSPHPSLARIDNGLTTIWDAEAAPATLVQRAPSRPEPMPNYYQTPPTAYSQQRMVYHSSVVEGGSGTQTQIPDRSGQSMARGSEPMCGYSYSQDLFHL